MFDEDLERRKGLPNGASQLRQLMIDRDGLLLGSPEYKGSFTAVLKSFRRRDHFGEPDGSIERPTSRAYRKTPGRLSFDTGKETSMPYANIQITPGATREQKAELVHELTDLLVRLLDKKPEHIHIVIQEIAEEDWGFQGLLTDEWKRRKNE